MKIGEIVEVFDGSLGIKTPRGIVIPLTLKPQKEKPQMKTHKRLRRLVKAVSGDQDFNPGDGVNCEAFLQEYIIKRKEYIRDLKQELELVRESRRTIVNSLQSKLEENERKIDSLTFEFCRSTTYQDLVKKILILKQKLQGQEEELQKRKSCLKDFSEMSNQKTECLYEKLRISESKIAFWKRQAHFWRNRHMDSTT